MRSEWDLEKLNKVVYQNWLFAGKRNLKERKEAQDAGQDPF